MNHLMITIIGIGEGIPGDPYDPPSVNMSDPFRFLININNTNLHFHISHNLFVGAGLGHITMVALGQLCSGR